MRFLVVLSLTAVVAGAANAGGPFGIDHRVAEQDSGIWNRNVQKTLEYGTVATVIAGAAWEGADDRLGKTWWQALDSMALSAATAEAMKHVFTRARPSQTDDPDAFFQGQGHYSFPSDEVATIAGAVAPFVFEYGREYPAAYGLEALMLYDMIARVKTGSHWQSDVIASAVIGTGIGYYAHSRDTPLILSVLPHGAWIGLRKQF